MWRPLLAGASVCATIMAALPSTAQARPSVKRSPGKVDEPAPPCLLVPVDLAVSEDISIDGHYRPRCATNYFGLVLGWSRAGQLRGAQLGVGLNIVERDAFGLQVAGAALAGIADRVSRSGDTVVRQWPGISVGVAVRF